MLKQSLVTGLQWGLLTLTMLGTTTACVAPPAETAPQTERSAYGAISLPPEAQRLGPAPEAIALAAFGLEEPTEGNFNQAVEVVEQTSERAIVTLTQTGLLDDSVEGVRYWLEFDAGENAWEMVWAGRQVRCYAGRGSQEWTTELCN